MESEKNIPTTGTPTPTPLGPKSEIVKIILKEISGIKSRLDTLEEKA